MAINYPQLMEESILKLSDLTRQRRKLDREIARLKRLICSTARTSQLASRTTRTATPSFDISAIGFTAAIRRVLDTYRIWLTPVLIRDLLPTVGFSTSRYKEPLPSIHVILNRLAVTGEVIRSSRPNGHIAYLWAAEAFQDSQETPGRFINVDGLSRKGRLR
jgi:hypothetical protein